MDLKEFESFKTLNSRRHPWELARLLFVRRLFDEFYVKNKLKSKFILDIGCGDGYIVSHLALNFSEYQFVGVDTYFSREDIEFLRHIYPYDNIKFTNKITHEKYTESIGCVFLLDVLEHIENDEKFLKRLIEDSNLTDDALFIITVPAFNKLFSSHDQALHHFRRYNASQLKRILVRSGLSMVENGYIFIGPLILRYFEILKERLNRHAQSKTHKISQWKGGWLSTALLRTILYHDACVGRIFSKMRVPLWGLTCYAICRKHV